MGEIIEKIIVGLQQALKNDYLVTFIIVIPAIEVRGFYSHGASNENEPLPRISFLA